MSNLSFKAKSIAEAKKNEEKNDFSMQSGTLEERQTNKSPTFVHVTPRALCHASGNLVF